MSKQQVGTLLIYVGFFAIGHFLGLPAALAVIAIYCGHKLSTGAW